MSSAAAQLPGFWHLIWLLFMQPIQLHRRLRATGIGPDASGWQLWHSNEAGSDLRRTYIYRMAAILMLVPCFAAGMTLLAPAIVNPVGLEIVALFMPTAVVFVVAFAMASVVVFSVNLGVALGVAVGVAAVVTVLVGAVIGVPVGAALGLAVGMVMGMAVGVGFGAAVGVMFGVAVGVAGGVVFGMAVGVAVGMAVGVASGVGSAVGMFRLPLYPLEVSIQTVLAMLNSPDRPTLRYAPPLWHDLSYMPLPFLRSHILETAASEPMLARRMIERCTDVPGQRRVGQQALASLQVRELARLLETRDFPALQELRGIWLPGLADAPTAFIGFTRVGRYLLAAQTAMIPYYRLQHLEGAKRETSALRNVLVASQDRVARELLPIAESCIALIDHLQAEAKQAAASVLPNPFRAGEPLSPDQGREVFRGREGLIRRVEASLVDPTASSSLLLLGPRRCGKTSLLKMLPLYLPDTVTVLFDIQDNPCESVDSFVAAIVRRTHEQARSERKPELPALPLGPPLESLGRWFEMLEDGYGDRVLIAIDEFERLAPRADRTDPGLWPGDQQSLLRLMGLFRATIQHRRRVRLLVSGAAPFDELGRLWNDHFINVREIRLGHLERDVARELLMKPITTFPEGAIPRNVADRVVERSGCQPFLVQLFGKLLVQRVNDKGRNQATLDDVSVVEAEIMSEGDAIYYFRNTYDDAGEAGRVALRTLATGNHAIMDQTVHRWLRRRLLIDPDDRLTIPVFGRWLLERADD